MPRKRNVLIFGCLMLLGACGIKPGEVAPPESDAASHFPRTYPDVRTDPAPYTRGL
ncbi:MAG: hypothetical protein IT559_05850 [Alphaproteobacteria bacterium]|nr:hypothetical protein [Alphaproteobacteria bacterium]